MNEYPGLEAKVQRKIDEQREAIELLLTARTVDLLVKKLSKLEKQVKKLKKRVRDLERS